VTHWPFILGAYAAAFAATAGLALSSYAAMRRAEAVADALRGER
jgi:Na+/H+-translocating membrane pyrophosphatase